MAIIALMGVVEAECPLKAEPSVLTAAQPYTDFVDALIEPLHAGGPARIATECLGTFGSGPACAPERKGRGSQNHQ